MEPHLWGPAIWYFFHGIAEKIRADKFTEQKQNLFDILDIVCQFLPCPDCSEHALNEIKKINKNNITSKEIYKELLLEFHNRVNIRLHKPRFTKQQLDDKYKNININAMMHNFNIGYNVNIYNERALQIKMMKQMKLSELYEKINVVLSCCI